MARRLLTAPFSLAVLSACTSTDESMTTPSVGSSIVEPSSTDARKQPGTPFAVESLGLTFDLAPSFLAADDADYVFFARSQDPRSLVTIAEASPAVINHESEGDETVTRLDLAGVKAVVVTDAVLEGLPPGISANELLVSNGPQSFSVIMSAETAALADSWDHFVRSVSVAPSG